MNALIKREKRIFIKQNLNGYDVFNRDNEKVFSSEQDFSIYLKNVNLRADGSIDGTYLGDNPSNIIDDKCIDVMYDGTQWKSHLGDVIKTGRLVAIMNSKKVILIIHK